MSKSKKIINYKFNKLYAIRHFKVTSDPGIRVIPEGFCYYSDTFYYSLRFALFCFILFLLNFIGISLIVGEDVFSLATGFPNKNKMLSRYFNFYVLSIFSYLSYTTLDHLS